MTHFEELKQATTKKEFEEILFEFETDVTHELVVNKKIGLDASKWLDEEKCPPKTALKGLTVLLGGLLSGGKSND